MTKIKDPNRMHCQAIYMEPLLLFCYTLADSPGEKHQYGIRDGLSVCFIINHEFQIFVGVTNKVAFTYLQNPTQSTFASYCVQLNLKVAEIKWFGISRAVDPCPGCDKGPSLIT